MRYLKNSCKSPNSYVIWLIIEQFIYQAHIVILVYLSHFCVSLSVIDGVELITPSYIIHF